MGSHTDVSRRRWACAFKVTARGGYGVVVQKPRWDDAGMVRDPAEATVSELAVMMRTALVRAQWDPDGDPAVAVDVLGDLVAGVCGPVASVAVGRTVFDSEALGTVYLFCASVNKTIDRNHSAQPLGHRGLSTAEHLALVRPLLPGFHRRQQEVLRLLDQEFPPHR